jgi:hypothetical protein
LRKFSNFERLLRQDPTGSILQYIYLGDTGELNQEYADETMLRELWMIVIIVAFAAIFALNSSIHSFLVVSYDTHQGQTGRASVWLVRWTLVPAALDDESRGGS